MKLLLQYPIRVFFSLIIFCRHSIITKYNFFYIKPDTNSNSIATPTCTSHGCRCPCPVYTVSHGFVRTSGVSGCAWVQSSATIGYSVIELVSICYINRNWTIYQKSKRKKKIKGHGIKLFKWAKQFPIFFFCLTTSDHQLCPITLNNPFFVIHTTNHHSISLKVSNLRLVIILQLKFQRIFCC